LQKICQDFDDSEILNSDGEILKNDSEILDSDGEILKNAGEILKNAGEILKKDSEILKKDSAEKIIDSANKKIGGEKKKTGGEKKKTGGEKKKIGREKTKTGGEKKQLSSEKMKTRSEKKLDESDSLISIDSEEFKANRADAGPSTPANPFMELITDDRKRSVFEMKARLSQYKGMSKEEAMNAMAENNEKWALGELLVADDWLGKDLQKKEQFIESITDDAQMIDQLKTTFIPELNTDDISTMAAYANWLLLDGKGRNQDFVNWKEAVVTEMEGDTLATPEPPKKKAKKKQREETPRRSTRKPGRK
jgi:hypothetical protein